MQGLTENLTRLLLRLVPGASIIAQYVFDKNYEVSIPDRSDWIANNVDIAGNEEADKLAKQAAAAEYIGPEPALGFSTIAVRSKVWQWAHNEHYINTGLILKVADRLKNW